jgi:hypothetical protein
MAPGRENTGAFYLGGDGADIIVGRNGDDHIEGFDGDDMLFGGAGNDALVGGKGNDYIDGGPGYDIAVFSGLRSEYTVERQSFSQYRVVGPDGIDTVVGVESLQFADTTLPLGPASGIAFPFTNDPFSQVEMIYIAYFGRAGDPMGTNFWVNDLLSMGDTPATLQNIAASFSVQPEAMAEYPLLANPQGASQSQIASFITSIYQDLFNRGPDAGGLNFWTSFFASNLGNPQAVGSFILDVIYGAQNSAAGLDQTTIANKVTVAEWLTNEFAAAGIISFGGGVQSAVLTFAHTLMASVTSDPASVIIAEQIPVVGVAATNLIFDSHHL